MAATVVVALATAMAAAPATASGTVRLDVLAGAGGIVRPFRWTPVRVSLENQGPDVSGQLSIEWGDVRLHRAVTLAGRGRLEFETYVRAGEVRNTISVRLITDDRATASVEAPVRAISEDATLNLCAAVVGTLPAAADCTVTVSPSLLPRSARGYDAVDRVTFLAGAESALTAAQRSAVERWRAYHALALEDLLGRAPRATLTDASAQRPPASSVIAGSTYLIVLLFAGVAWLRRPRRAVYAYGSLVLALVVATAGSVSAGLIGPGAAIVLRHATTLLQVGDGSLITLRGSVEYPDFNRFELRSLVADGALTVRTAPSPELWFDDEGLPVRHGTFARGSREEVEFEGVTAFAPFRLMAEGDVLRVTNASDTRLSDCRFPDGFSPPAVGDVGPGMAVEARQLAASDSPFFACTLDGLPVSFTDTRFPVRAEGVTIASVRLPDLRATGGLQ